ncbi:Uncharacterized protein QTN25_008619 [Entamoeba marina]
MSDKKTSKKENKKSKGKGEPVVIDNTNDTFEMDISKNKEFDFGDSSEEESITPRKKKFSIVLNEQKTVKTPSTFQVKTLPPSRTRSSLTTKNDFDKGLQSFENANYSQAIQHFHTFSQTSTPQQSTLCLAYLISCNILKQLQDSPDAVVIYLSSILIQIPLLPPHRQVIFRIVKWRCKDLEFILPDYMKKVCGNEQRNGETLKNICWSCHKEVNLLDVLCHCGKERLFDCKTFAPIRNDHFVCEKCGAVYAQEHTCVYCDSQCHPYNN